MGLFSTTNHFHGRPDNSVNVRFPDTVKIHEHKAPTDESIKLLDEMYAKTVDSIVVKIEVSDNLVNGTIFLIDQLRTHAINNMEMIVKFSINGHEFVVKKEISRSELWDNETKAFIENINEVVRDSAKSIMLWFAFKMFATVAYEQITGNKVPDHIIKDFL